jgi:uncharacterized RDD family membrane protein YckC
VDEPTSGDAGDTLASFTRRAIGLAVDSAVVALPIVVAAAVAAPGGVATIVLAILVLAHLAVSVVYQTVLVARYGRTLGHRLGGLIVVRRCDGGPVALAAAGRRAVLPAVALVVPGVGAALVAIVYLRALFHPLGQGLHDAVAGTVVVRREHGSASSL